MTATAVMDCCAHCGKPVPGDSAKGRDAWGIYDVPHGSTIVTVAVCPSCRLGVGRVDEHHEPGTCGGYYKGDDAYVATCREFGCKQRWACWDKACVKGWQDEHYEEHDECEDCNGHHNSKLAEPRRPR